MTEDNNKHRKTADGTDGKLTVTDAKGDSGDSETGEIDWHAGFVHAMRLYLRHYEDSLHFEEEYQLTRKPLRIDLTVIKKRDNAVIDNNIGRFFRKYNLLEYKSPNTKLDLTVFYKVLAYACLYVSLPVNLTEKGQPINREDVTVTFVKATQPKKLLRDLQISGYTVTVSDIIKETFEEFISMTGDLNVKQLQYAETVTQVVSAANEYPITNEKTPPRQMISHLPKRCSYIFTVG